VYYVLESQRLEFCILTEMSWDAFRQEACTQLDADATRVQLAYRLYTDGYSKADGLTRLVNENDWNSVMAYVGKEFEYSNDVELEILDVNNTVSSFLTLWRSTIFTLQHSARRVMQGVIYTHRTPTSELRTSVCYRLLHLISKHMLSFIQASCPTYRGAMRG
jgi:hypothetical protein